MNVRVAIVDLYGYFRTAATCATSLLNFDFIHAGCFDLEIPVGPILGVRPIAKHVLVGLRLVAQRVAVNVSVLRVQADVASSRV